MIPEISGGGHFFDLASHQLDYLDFLLGPVKKVASVVLNQAGLYPAEDFVSAGFEFQNNVAGYWNTGVLLYHLKGTGIRLRSSVKRGL